MNKIRTVIVDDEPLARERIRTLLGAENDFEIVAECADGTSAVESIEKLEPDLVFLDIQMPVIDGFDVLLALEAERMPAVIFATAYDRYAVRAFEVHALDYLLKPFDSERFAEALDRARAKIRSRQGGDLRRELAGFLAENRENRQPSERLLVRSSDRIVILPAGDIDWIEAAGNYMRLHAGAETYLIRETMHGMEARLPPERFLRIHRSTIVNLDRIKEMIPMFNNELKVVLHNGRTLKLSRKYRPALEERLGKPL